MMTPTIILVTLLVLAGMCLFAGYSASKDHYQRNLDAMMTMSPNVTSDVRMWPYYYYTLPYRYEQGGAWPPGMYTRMKHWQPGYDVHGWSFDMRPGMGYDKWRRNVWTKNNGSKYFIDNGTQDDRIYDYFGVR